MIDKIIFAVCIGFIPLILVILTLIILTDILT